MSDVRPPTQDDRYREPAMSSVLGVLHHRNPSEWHAVHFWHGPHLYIWWRRSKGDHTGDFYVRTEYPGDT